MFVVPRPAMAPGYCIVSMSGDDPNGFIDTGLTPPIADPRVYVSHQAVVDMAREFGYDIASIAGRDAELEQLRHEVDQLRDQLAEADKFAEAAEYTLNTFDTRIRNKPGRKPKETAA